MDPTDQCEVELGVARAMDSALRGAGVLRDVLEKGGGIGSLECWGYLDRRRRKGQRERR
ncbi:hypothetical protein BDV93DRAFT_122274 [Ceratobasidium sp. AG-I]|nr:hypothetical protein BDV93DRAFT_122274 [Ceratobasidium sp. AG-I]